MLVQEYYSEDKIFQFEFNILYSYVTLSPLQYLFYRLFRKFSEVFRLK